MKTLPIIQHIKRFIESLAAEKGYSPHTQRAYRHNLLEMTAFAADIPDWTVDDPQRLGHVQLEAMDTLQVRRYLAHLHKKKQKNDCGPKISGHSFFFQIFT